MFKNCGWKGKCAIDYVVQSVLKLAGNEFKKQYMYVRMIQILIMGKFIFEVDKSVKRFGYTVLLPLNGLTNDGKNVRYRLPSYFVLHVHN